MAARLKGLQEAWEAWRGDFGGVPKTLLKSLHHEYFLLLRSFCTLGSPAFGANPQRKLRGLGLLGFPALPKEDSFPCA